MHVAVKRWINSSLAPGNLFTLVFLSCGMFLTFFWFGFNSQLYIFYYFPLQLATSVLVSGCVGQRSRGWGIRVGPGNDR